MSFDRRKFLHALAERGIVIFREGADHTIVRGPGTRPEPVPRHRQLNRITAKRIIRNLGLDWDTFERDIR